MAPAGSPDAGYAALEYGADAVYLGLQKFSARRDAVNFTLDELDEFIGYAHSMTDPRCVYVAMNTLLFDDEVTPALETLADIRDMGVDAVIVQDFGLADLIHRFFPQLKVHASTQMAVHNLSGVRTLERMGYKRVTLARELTLDEISGIAGSTEIEIECFVHGALCYSYSGLCLYSSMLRGRSGNRGECAYSCRDAFHCPGEDARLPFSMKDAGFDKNIRELSRAGVSSLKIEGRMKKPLYVAAVVNYYRKLMNGNVCRSEIQSLRSDIHVIYSRPWTELFLKSTARHDVIDPSVTGHRGEPVGTVYEKRSSRSGCCVLFRNSRRIERHDGLQFDAPDLKRPFGFGVDEIRILKTKDSRRGRKVVAAPAGSWVEILLPKAHPEIKNGDIVYLSSSAEVKRKYTFQMPRPGIFSKKHPVNITVEITSKGISMAGASADKGNQHRNVFAEVFEPASLEAARKPERVHDIVDKAVRRTGSTRFTVCEVTVENPNDCVAPSSVMNAARRSLTDKLEAEFQQSVSRTKLKIHNQSDSILPKADSALHSQPAFTYSIKTDDASAVLQIPDLILNSLSEVIVNVRPLASDKDNVQDILNCFELLQPGRFRAALPVIARAHMVAEISERIKTLKDAGVNQWQISNLSGWDLLALFEKEGRSFDVSGDWPLYSTNSHAVRAWCDRGLSSVTLSPEDTLKNSEKIAARFPGQITAVVYQDTPLFMSAACARAAYSGGCRNSSGKCAPGEWSLINDSWKECVRVITADCETVVVNDTPYSRLDDMDAVSAAGIRNVRSDFVFRQYTPEKIITIIRKMTGN